jgi:putative ABC transport system permease protein
MVELIFAELRHRTGRVAGTALGVALGVALFLALTAFGNGFREAARLPLSGIGADMLLSRPAGNEQSKAASQVTRGPRFPFGLSTFTKEEISSVRRIEGVSVAGALLIWDFGGGTYKTALGVDLTETETGPGNQYKNVTAGRFLKQGDSGVVVTDKHYAALFRIKPGSTVLVGGKNFTVIGIVEAKDAVQAAAANFYISLADAQSLVASGNGIYNQIYVRMAHASAIDKTLGEIRDKIGEVSAITEQSIIQVMGGIARISDRFSWLASVVALLGGLALTGLAFASNVAERRQEIGIAKAVGWTRSYVGRFFLAEGFVVSVLGALAGLLLGWLLSFMAGLLPIDLSLASPSMPKGIVIESSAPIRHYLPVHISPLSILLGLCTAVIGGGVVSFIVARRAAGFKPAESLRK